MPLDATQLSVPAAVVSNYRTFISARLAQASRMIQLLQKQYPVKRARDKHKATLAYGAPPASPKNEYRLRIAQGRALTLRKERESGPLMCAR